MNKLYFWTTIAVQFGSDEPRATKFGDFLAENIDALSRDDITKLFATLEKGEPFFFGGGAGPMVTVKQEARHE